MPARSMQLYEREKHHPVPRKPAKKTGIGRLDAPALLITLMLIIVGLVALFSASYPSALYSASGDPFLYIRNQAIFAVVGVAAMLFVSMLDYHIYVQLQKPLFLVGIALLVLILIPGVGKDVKGAVRWIELPGLGQFQPSELMKTGVILSFSFYASQLGKNCRTFGMSSRFLARWV